MTREQILDYIKKMDWADQPWEKTEQQVDIERAVAQYVVYMQDPDTYATYGHEYHWTKAAALVDYESRTTNDRLCYCVVAELHGDWMQQRNVSR